MVKKNDQENSFTIVSFRIWQPMILRGGLKYRIFCAMANNERLSKKKGNAPLGSTEQNLSSKSHSSEIECCKS